MAEIAEIWQEVLPAIKQSVTGVGVWTALNSATPVAHEDGVFVLGLPHESSELAGHLRMHATKMLIEKLLGEKLGERSTVRIIDGTSPADWETVKRRDAEARRLQEAAINRARAEIESRSSWETIYEQISRRYAQISNKSLPQNRAAFFRDAVQIVVEGLLTHPVDDDLSERNYARCLERIAQYTELPSVFVALRVMEESTK